MGNSQRAGRAQCDVMVSVSPSSAHSVSTGLRVTFSSSGCRLSKCRACGNGYSAREKVIYAEMLWPSALRDARRAGTRSIAPAWPAGRVP